MFGKDLGCRDDNLIRCGKEAIRITPRVLVPVMGGWRCNRNGGSWGVSWCCKEPGCSLDILTLRCL